MPENYQGDKECPCCGGTAAVMRDGWHCCVMCQRAPWHDSCGHCWDHCKCQPHPIQQLSAYDYARAMKLPAPTIDVVAGILTYGG